MTFESLITNKYDSIDCNDALVSANYSHILLASLAICIRNAWIYQVYPGAGRSEMDAMNEVV
jgi:hypothetical protein